MDSLYISNDTSYNISLVLDKNPSFSILEFANFSRICDYKIHFHRPFDEYRLKLI